MAFSGLLVGSLIVLVIIVPIAGILLRAGVSFANKLLGPKPVTGGSDRAETWADEHATTMSSPVEAAGSEPVNPYRTPRHAESLAVVPVGVIPAPSFGYACGIAFVAGFVNLISTGVIEALFSPASGGLAYIALKLFANVVVYMTIYKFMLPTSFGRAALVWFLQFLSLIHI